MLPFVQETCFSTRESAHYSSMLLVATIIFAQLSSLVRPIRNRFIKLREDVDLQVQDTKSRLKSISNLSFT